MRKLLQTAATIAALASAGTVHAAATQVNFGFVPVGEITYTGGNLGSSTELIFDPQTFFFANTVGATPPFADDAGSFTGMEVFLSALSFSYTVGQTTPFDLVKTFTTGPGGAAGSEGDYEAVFTSVTASSDDPDFLNLVFDGTITGPDGFSANDVQLVNCNQSGGSTAAVNCSFTEQGPPVTVPVATTPLLMGLGLFCLGLLRRRA